jgi:hypothetical protein
MLDEILDKLVASKDGSACSDRTAIYSVAKRVRIYEENTEAYMNGVPHTTVMSN